MGKRVDWKVIIFVLAISFLVFLTYYAIQPNPNRRDLIEHALFTTGHIVNVRVDTAEFKRDFTYYYLFSARREVVSYFRYNPATRRSVNGQLLKGKKFPVIYSSTNPQNHSLLIFPEDFEAYQLPFPDSLRWVDDLSFE